MHSTGKLRITTGARATCFAGLITAIAVPAVAQTTKTLTVAKDATIRGGSYATTRYGSATRLETRRSDNAEYERRAVLTFDTETTIPDNSTIASAKLVLTVRGGNSETRRLETHSIPISFDEPYVSWRQRKSGLSWKYPGGEVTGSPSAATVYASPGGQVTFDVTAIVQKVINGSYGSRYARFLVADSGATSRESYREYHSREASTSSYRPRLVVTYGGSTSTSTATSGSTSSGSTTSGSLSDAPSTSSTLKVVDWNIHHGVGTDSRYNLQRFVTWLARWRPDVVSLNEVEKYTSWGNEDQPKRFRDLLQSATGQRWYVHFAQRYTGGTGNGQGNVILSRYPFVSASSEVLSYDRSLAIAAIVVNGRNVTLMSTHLDADSNARRETQVRQIASHASAWSQPRVVAGDFNAWPDHYSIAIMSQSFSDGWAEAVAAGTASSFSGNSPFGATKRGRIDYIWRSRGSSLLKVRSAQVVDTRDASGVMPSDHRPLLVTYQVQ